MASRSSLSAPRMAHWTRQSRRSQQTSDVMTLFYRALRPARRLGRAELSAAEKCPN